MTTTTKDPSPATRYVAKRSNLFPNRWIVIDLSVAMAVRTRGHIAYYATVTAAKAAALKLNTERMVCVGCRHKVLAADCKLKLCPTCQRKATP